MCNLFQRILGNNLFASCSVLFTLFPFENPHLYINLWICVSTGNAGVPKAWETTTLAVLCPTEGNFSSSLMSFGTTPLNFSIKIFDNP